MTEAPLNEATGSPRQLGRTWPDYVAALLGSMAGGYLLGGILVRWGIQSQPGSLAFAMFGPILLIPLGSALGTMLALAVFRRHSPVLTGVLTLPVTVAVWIVVAGLTRLIDSMDYGWLMLVPPLVAPLGARFIVLGRNPAPSVRPPPAAHRNWPTRRTLRYGISIILVVLVAWLLISRLDLVDSDLVELAPEGPRVCECEQLKEWVGSLVISPDGDTFRESGVRAAETPAGYIVIGSQYPGADNSHHYLRRVFRETGLSAIQLLDEPGHWAATFFDGDTRAGSSWIVDVTLLDYRIEMTIRVRVDGSEWGVGNTEQLWDLYVSDRQAALRAQEERQARALDNLEPVERAFEHIRDQ